MGLLKRYRKRGQCLFTVHSALPHLLAVSAYSERKHIYARAHTWTPPTTADPVKAWSPVFFGPRLSFHMNSSMPRKAWRHLYQPDITWFVILLSSPISTIPVKASSLSPFPSPLGGTGQQIQKLQHRKGKSRQAELCTHTCMCAERQHDHTRISLGNQIKNQSTLCQL